MFKRIKILIVAFLLSTAIISMLAIRWDLAVKDWILKIPDKFNKEDTLAPTPTPVAEEPAENSSPDESCAVLKDSPANFQLFFPVPEHFLESALFDVENPRGIIFSLPAETLIKSVFTGKVKEVLPEQKPFEDESQFDQIIIESDDGEFLANYLIKGDALIQQGNIVTQVTILARTTEEDLNVYLQVYDKNGDIIKLSKEMFR